MTARAVPWLVVAAAICTLLAAAWAVDTHRTHTDPTRVPHPAANTPPKEHR